MQNFEYLQPKDIREASKSLGKDWLKALPYSGGTDLYSLIKDGIETPEKVVNLKNLPGMDQIEYTDGKGLKIGALVKIAGIADSPVIQEKYRALAQAAAKTASPQLRNMGTIGGNLCQRPRCWYFRGDFHCLRKGGDMCYAVDGENKYHCIIGGAPCFIVYPSDPAVALLALNAKVTIAKGNKSRAIPLKEFYILPEVNVERENILEPDEIVTGIEIPELPPNSRSAYLKFMERDVWDFAMVSVAAVVQVSGNQIQNGTVAYGGVAPVPWLEKKVSGRLKNFSLSKENIRKLSDQALEDAQPLSDNGYKLPLARNLLNRILNNLTQV